jgi:hypothetical protein
MTDLRDLIGDDDLTPEEEARLGRVHELLVKAGPPPEMPPALRELPGKKRREFPLFPRPRIAAAFVIAAAGVATVFGIGFLVGDRSDFSTDHVVAMQPTAAGPATAIASIEVGEQDEAGNWPLLLHVTRLPEQPADDYYELWLTRDGKPVATCGTFRVEGDRTTVRLNAPYKLKAFDGWVVTTSDHSRVLLKT